MIAKYKLAGQNPFWFNKFTFTFLILYPRLKFN